MKRSKMQKELDYFIGMYMGDGASYMSLAGYVLDLVEKHEMLPPPSECKLVPDERDGCMKHSESKREWNDET